MEEYADIISTEEEFLKGEQLKQMMLCTGNRKRHSLFSLTSFELYNLSLVHGAKKTIASHFLSTV